MVKSDGSIGIRSVRVEKGIVVLVCKLDVVANATTGLENGDSVVIVVVESLVTFCTDMRFSVVVDSLIMF